jgi:single-stranded-DNA-specific exonuclease
VLVTVDNGIASFEGVAAAKAAGLTVIVTDHHLPGATLPAADAIVNPNARGDEFPSKALAGAADDFQLIHPGAGVYALDNLVRPGCK